MLSMYVADTTKALEDLLGSAKNLQAKFDRHDDVESLLVDARLLDDRLRLVLDNLPKPAVGDSCRRHLGWLLRRLGENNAASCRSDIDDLVMVDIPDVIEKLKKWARNADYLEKSLRDAAAPLIKSRQFDSAIRKAIVLLTARLRENYGLPSNIDGEDLVNKVFGKDSGFHAGMEAGEKQAYRNLFAGLYGVIRNKFSHNNQDATLAETQATISMVNLCLLTLEDIKATK